MRISRSSKIRLIIAAVIVLAAAVLGGAWYFIHGVGTPEKTMEIVQKAAASHDVKTFEKYVDVDTIADVMSDGMVEGLIESDRSLSGDTRDAMSGFVDMFKSPIKASLKNAIMSYVKTGSFEGDSALSADEMIILQKTGLDDIELKSVKGVYKSSDNEATADVLAYSREADSEFTFTLLLEKGDEGFFRIKKVTNFKEYIDFVMAARKNRLVKYMGESHDIIDKYDDVIKDADKKLIEIMHRGSLGDDSVRSEMRDIMANDVLEGWKNTKNDLSALDVPEGAETYHRILLKVCDSRIQYAEAYIEWLGNKDAKTIHKSNEALKTAQTLEKEAKLLEEKIKKRIGE